MNDDAMKAQDNLAQSYQRVFSTPDGKKVLEHLMTCFHVRTIAKGMDPYDTYFRDGQRSVVMHILGHLDLNLKEFRRKISSVQEETHDDI